MPLISIDPGETVILEGSEELQVPMESHHRHTGWRDCKHVM